MKTEEKSVFYQIVDEKGTPVNNLIYTNLEFAEGYCDHLRHNYRKWHWEKFITYYEVRELILSKY